MKIVIRMISYVFIFLLVIALLVGIALGIMSKTILDQEYIMAKLEETNYYETVYHNLLTHVEEYAKQFEIQEMDIHHVLTEEQVKSDVNDLVMKLYNGEKVTIQQIVVEEQLKDNLKKEIEGENKFSTMEEAVDNMISAIAKIYVLEISYGNYSKYLDAASSLMSIANENLFLVTLVVYSLPVIISAIILLFHYNQFRIGLRYLGIALVIEGVVMIGINIFINTNIDLQNLFILNKITSDFIARMSSEILGKITMIGGISIGIGILFLIIGATYKKKEKEDEEIKE